MTRRILPMLLAVIASAALIAPALATEEPEPCYLSNGEPVLDPSGQPVCPEPTPEAVCIYIDGEPTGGDQACGSLIPCEFYGTVWVLADGAQVPVRVTIDAIYLPPGFTLADCEEEPAPAPVPTPVPAPAVPESPAPLLPDTAMGR